MTLQRYPATIFTYRCQACGHLEEKSYPVDSWRCPTCGRLA